MPEFGASDGPQNIPPDSGKYMRATGRVQTTVIRPMREMLAGFESPDEPEKSTSWVTTAPMAPPLPVIPDTTPRDLRSLSNFSNIEIGINIPSCL